MIATGADSEVGRISGALGAVGRRRSPLQIELDRLVRLLLIAALGLIVITGGQGLIRGNTLGEALLAAISAAIAAIPEEPPVLLAVILGLGAYRLLRRDVLVRRLNAQETLGAVDLILTDKTGTLTRNRLEVADVLTPRGAVPTPRASPGACRRTAGGGRCVAGGAPRHGGRIPECHRALEAKAPLPELTLSACAIANRPPMAIPTRW